MLYLTHKVQLMLASEDSESQILLQFNYQSNMRIHMYIIHL